MGSHRWREQQMAALAREEREREEDARGDDHRDRCLGKSCGCAGLSAERAAEIHQGGF